MDFTNTADRLEFVKNQCRNLPSAKFHDDYTMICCPFHSDKNPSGRITHSRTSRAPGFFHCYGCGATASWNELAPLIGCQPFNQKPTVRYARPVTVDEESEEQEEQLIFSPLPRGKKWRSISTNLLIDIGCQLCRVQYDNGLSDKFVYMPVRVNQELKGYIKARMHKQEGKLSYVNKKGGWSLKYGLFPFDYAISKMTETKTIVLVEGQRDALRLLSLGIPALCIMGTQSWSDSKSRLLEMYGCERCVIFLDGDDAGISGTHKVYNSLKNFLPTKVLKLWAMRGSPYLRFKDHEKPSAEAKAQGVELWDPGNCPVEILTKIKKRYIDVNS